MKRELGIVPLESSSFQAISDIEGLTEEIVLNVIKTMQLQSSQLIKIKQFYDDYKEFCKLNFEINKLINEIKRNVGNQIDLQKISRLIAKYTYSFYEYVTFSEIYAKEHDKNILKEHLISVQFDTCYEYRVAYHLGNYVKHVSQFIPLIDFVDQKEYVIAIDNKKIIEKYTSLSKKHKEIFTEKDKLDLLDYLDVTEKCIYVQMMCFIKYIFVDQEASNFFKVTYQFLEKYGFPAFLDVTDENDIQITIPNDISSNLHTDVAKITNSLGLSHFTFID